MNEMKMLLWKDYRLSRGALIAGGCAIFMPYLFLIFPSIEYGVIWILDIFISQVTIAIVAGNIIACERSDRSAFFLAFQGVSRKKVISCKLLICVFVYALVCTITSVISLTWPVEGLPFKEMCQMQGIAAMVGFCLFGCSWLLSSIQSSPLLAILIGIISTILIMLFTMWTFMFLQFPRQTAFYFIFVSWIMAGMISLSIGTWHFVQSKE